MGLRERWQRFASLSLRGGESADDHTTQPSTGGFDDPPALTRDLTDEAAILAVYRRVRDEIRDYVAGLPGNLDAAEVDR